MQSFPGDQQKICCGVLQVSDWIVWHDSASYVHWRLIQIASFPNTSQRADKWQLGPFSSPPCLVHDEFQIYRCNPFKSSLFLHVKIQDPVTYIYNLQFQYGLLWFSIIFWANILSLSLSLCTLCLHTSITYVTCAIDVLPEIHRTRPGADDSTIAPSDVDGQGQGDDQHQGGDSKGMEPNLCHLGKHRHRHIHLEFRTNLFILDMMSFALEPVQMIVTACTYV